jgi:DNA-binding NarL/FixJ family response regulator
MQRIKILLSNRPKMLSDVIRKLIDRQPDMEVLGEVLDPIDLLLVTRATPVDIVIVTPLEANGEPRICRHLFAEHPHLKILTMSATGEAACLYQSGCDKKRLNDVSWQLILGAIRESCDHNQTEIKT